MSRIATEKYCMDLGKPLVNYKHYAWKVKIPDDDVSTFGYPEVYLPIGGEEASVFSGTMILNRLYSTNSLEHPTLWYIDFNSPEFVFDGFGKSCYWSITDLDPLDHYFVTDAIFTTIDTHKACTTKLAKSYGCQVQGNREDLLLITLSDAAERSRVQIRYCNTYVSVSKGSKYSSDPYNMSYNTSGKEEPFAFNDSEPIMQELDLLSCLSTVTYRKGRTVRISAKTSCPFIINHMLVIEEDTFKVLAEGGNNLQFTLTTNCWIYLQNITWKTLSCEAPYNTSDTSYWNGANVSVKMTDSSTSSSGTILLSKSAATTNCETNTISMSYLINKYLCIYTTNYVTPYEVFIQDITTGDSYPLTKVNSTNNLINSTTWFNFKLPNNTYPNTSKSWLIWWSVKDTATLIPSSPLRPVPTLTINTTDVGTVKVAIDGGTPQTYTSPLTCTSGSQVTLSWTKTDQFTITEKSRVFTALSITSGQTYSLKRKITNDTTITFTLNPLVCTYTTIDDSLLTLGLNWDSNNSITKHYYSNGKYYVDSKPSSVVGIQSTLFDQEASLLTIKLYATSLSYTVLPTAFYNCTNLQTADFSTVTSATLRFQDSVFYLCSSLQTVNLGNNVKSFGENCFAFSGITEFTCPTQITKIPKQCFFGCPNLTKVDLSKATSLKTIDEQAFCGSTTYAVVGDLAIGIPTGNITSVTIPYSISAIKQGAFKNNTLLNAINTSPSKVTFSDLTKPVIFKTTSTYTNSMTSLDDRVFEYCTQLQNVLLPSSITHVGRLAFRSCPIRYFQAPGLVTIGSDVFYGHECEDVDLKLSDCTLYNNGLYGKSSLAGFYFSNITNVGTSGCNPNYPFEIYIRPDESLNKYILYKLHARLFGTSTLAANRVNVKPVSGTVSIAPYAYANKDHYTTQFEPDVKVTHRSPVGSAQRFQVKNVDLSECSNLSSIGYYSFFETFAERVIFPNSGSLTSLGKGAFRDCTRLSILDNLGIQKITEIPDECFYNCGKNGTGIGAAESIDGTLHPVVLPSSITRIGDSAFYNCKQLMLLDGALAATKLKTLGNYSFYNCFSYAPNPDYARIGYYIAVAIGTVVAGALTAGAAAGAIVTLVSVASVVSTVAGELAFWGAGYNEDHQSDLAYANMVFPYVTSIGTYCFAEGKLLKSIILGPITEIPEGAFYNCDSLDSVVFHNGVDRIEVGAEVTGYPSKVTKVGKKAFAKCSSLKYEDLNYILSKVVRIEDEAFFKCKKLGEGTLFLPPSLTYLGEKSLDITGGLTLRFLGSTPPTMHSNVFGNTMKSKITCYVPIGSKNAYVSAFGDQVKSSNIIEKTLSADEKSALQAIGHVI